MAGFTLVSTVVAPSFVVEGAIRIIPIDMDELQRIIPFITQNYCGHPLTMAVLRELPNGSAIPEAVKGTFWDGHGDALAVRPKGGVRNAAQNGDTQVTLDDLEAVMFYFDPA